MKQRSSILAIIAGVVLFIVGCNVTIPGDKLTTWSFEDEEYTLIEEYVGGDAYNYIIGVSLVGGQIAGATISKAVYISVGLLLLFMGLFQLSTVNKEKIISTEVGDEEISEDEETSQDGNTQDDTQNVEVYTMSI